MSDSAREAFERDCGVHPLVFWDDELEQYEPKHEGDRSGEQMADRQQAMLRGYKAALSANGGEVMAFGNGDYTVEVGGYVDEHAVFVAPAIPPGRVGDLAEPTTGEDKHRLVPGERVMTFPTEAQAFAVAEAIAGRRVNRLDGSHPAPPSVAVPEPVHELISGIRSINRAAHHLVRVTGDDEPCYYQRDEWIKWVLELADKAENAVSAPSPDHSGDANKVVDDLPGMWDQSDLSGGETDADHIADAGKVSFVDGLGAQRMTAEECKEGIEYIIHGDNIYWPLSDDDELRLIQAACGNGEFTYPQATPSVPENDNGVSSAYDSGYLDAMLYARVCCDRLDNPENTKDYRDCARFLDLIFKSEIDEAARLRQSSDGDDSEEETHG